MAVLYHEYECVGQIDWLEFGDSVSCFTLNTKKTKLDFYNIMIAIVVFGFILNIFKFISVK